jgi:hypothetical protein
LDQPNALEAVLEVDDRAVGIPAATDRSCSRSTIPERTSYNGAGQQRIRPGRLP